MKEEEGGKPLSKHQFSLGVKNEPAGARRGGQTIFSPFS